MEKLRKINGKKLVKSLTFLWGLILIVVMTITNIGIDEKFDFLKWLGNALIIFGIMVFGLFMGESMGKDKQMSKEDGLFQKQLKAYRTFKEGIDNIIAYFIPFFQWFLPQQVEEKKVTFLTGIGMNKTKAERIVKYCTLDDFEKLKSDIFIIPDEFDKDGKPLTIRKLQAFEIEPTRRVLSGEIKVDNSTPSYYLSAQASSNALTILEVGKQLDRDIKFNRHSNRIIKLSISLVVSVLFGILTVKEFMDGGDTQAWVNLISRITALFTSLFSGWLSAVIEIRLQAEKIENKVNVLKIFKNSYDKKIFVPKTEEELAQEELEEKLRNDQEAVNNVVDPVDNGTPLIPLKEEN